MASEAQYTDAQASVTLQLASGAAAVLCRIAG